MSPLRPAAWGAGRRESAGVSALTDARDRLEDGVERYHEREVELHRFVEELEALRARLIALNTGPPSEGSEETVQQETAQLITTVANDEEQVLAAAANLFQFRKALLDYARRLDGYARWQQVRSHFEADVTRITRSAWLEDYVARIRHL